MKKMLIFSTVVTAALLSSCAKYSRDPDTKSYYCQQIVREMHTVPHRYKSPAANKRLAITHSRLQKEYYHYDCELYHYRKANEQ